MREGEKQFPLFVMVKVCRESCYIKIESVIILTNGAEWRVRKKEEGAQVRVNRQKGEHV